MTEKHPNPATPADQAPIVTLFRHNLWANLGLFDACMGLTDEQLDTSAVGTYGTIRDTLHHIVAAENYYLWVLTGRPRDSRLTQDTPLTLTELREMAQQAGTALIEVAARTTGADVVQTERQGKMQTIPAAVILTQAINHGTEHRAHIMTILTQLGIKPPSLDGWSFFRAGQPNLAAG